MRSEIGKLTLDKTFEERETLNKNIIKAIEHEASDWGVLALRYEIKDIEPPQAIQKAMILQAESERKKRANILTSEGDRQANINVSEAEKQSQILQAEGAAEAMIIEAESSAKALSQIEEQLKQTGGKEAANFILGQRYISAYKKLGKRENTIVLSGLPTDVAVNVRQSLNVLEHK